VADLHDAASGPVADPAPPLLLADATVVRSSKSYPLDGADLRIIDALVADGRTHARSMTEVSGLSEETVAARIRSLIDRDIIGIAAILDWRAAGYQWDLFLSIANGPAERAIEALASFDEVVAIYRVLGPVDHVVHVLCRDRTTMLDFITSTVPGIGGIGTVEVMLALETVKFFHQFARVPVGAFARPLPAPANQLTSLDHGIIDALTRDGRSSHREIGRQLGVADGTIRSRHRRLVSSGLLRVRAQIHPTNSRIVGAFAFVGITTYGAGHGDVATRLAQIGEIMTIALTASRFDVFCYVVAPNRAHLIELISTRIRPIDGVRTVETWEVVAVPKQVGGWARW
jgi:DNA-binding Lrp family transcriptional regulator